MARILIVDDMPEIRRMLRRRLHHGHEIVGELSDGYVATSIVEQTQPEIVIVDFKMPTVSGVHVTKQLKALFPQVIVLGYTSSGDEVRERMLDAGAEAVFAKEDLTALIEFVDAVR